jgi:adenosine kinase
LDIIVSGSLAYDRIMDFPGYFADHILPEKIHVLNVSFTVNGLVEKFGGTAGNIAYALTLLGEKPRVVAAVGKDYQPYFDWLTENGVACDHITVVNETLTACAYITTDMSDNQITGFNAGAMKYPSSFDFSKLSPQETLAIIAPGNLQDMQNYAGVCRECGIGYIFDPGQSLPMWTERSLIRCLEGSRLLISNDYELEMITAKTGLGKKRLLELTGTVITTLGELGSCVCADGCEVRIPAVKPCEVVDPTGAGDAYRGGLIKGLALGKDIEESARMGSACASFAVECYGTQCYRFTPEEFEARVAVCST